MKPAVGRRLRIGLLLDSFVQPTWIDVVLADILAAGIAKFALVILNSAAEPATENSRKRRGILSRLPIWFRNRRSLPFAVYSKLDAKRYGTSEDPFRPACISGRLVGCPTVRVTPRQTKFSDYFSDEFVGEVLAYDLDVALLLGFRVLRGRALEIARFGVWSFHHGDNTVNRGGPAGFWEVAHKQETTGAVLQRLTDELDGGIILGRSTSCTNFSSVTVNRANYYWQASALLVRELKRLCEESKSAFENRMAVSAREWSAYSAPLYTAPGPGRSALMAARVGTRLLRNKAASLLWRDQWFLAYSRRASDSPTKDVPDGVMYRFKEIIPPRDRNWADPFVVAHPDGHHIFFEEHSFTSPCAHISVLAIDSKGVVGMPRRVLRRDYHLSYPQVFQWSGDWYMVPETFDRRAVELFRTTRFPDEWEFERPMLSDIPAVDPTIAEIDGLWWLFAGVIQPGATEASALHLFYGPTPLGPWTSHRRNPVKIDTRGARPAGRLFRHGGNWYRPGQDGAPRYGSGILIHRIDEISPAIFSETLVSRIQPTWRSGLNGAHTLNSAAGLTVIDARHSILRGRAH